MKKTILITGAGSGIGKDSAIALAKKGHRVIATTETESQSVDFAKYAYDQGLSIEIKKLDINNEHDRKYVNEYDIDVLINSAAIGESGPLSEVPLERLRAVFETNVFSTLAITQLVLKNMMIKKSGTIIVISSIAGRIPTTFLAPYGMTKFALTGGIAAMRDEIHKIRNNVHVSLIEPGTYGTGFNQKMFAKKYEWLNQASSFWSIIDFLKEQDLQFAKFEKKTTESIVKKIILATEAQKPKLRYVAPWYQATLVQIARIIGL